MDNTVLKEKELTLQALKNNEPVLHEEDFLKENKQTKIHDEKIKKQKTQKPKAPKSVKEKNSKKQLALSSLIKGYNKAKKQVIKNKTFGQDEVWLKLDNAALIYPSAKNSTWNSVFRESVYLKKEVDPIKLQKAVELTCKRFPHINVSLKRGVFWYYFQQLKHYPRVQEESDYPCSKFEIGGKNHLFRVLYYKNKISFETFHSLMDGTGAKNILCCLVGAYLSLTQESFQANTIYYNHLDRTNEEEIEDSFMRYADLKKTNSRKSVKTVQASGAIDKRRLNIVSGTIQIDQIKNEAKKYGATITDYILAIYFKAMFKHIKTKGRPLVISVPCNLRPMFESITLRNFASWVNINMKEDLPLNEMLDSIKQQMQAVNKENMLKNINSNVKAQKNWFVRILPLFLKNIALKFSYNKFGEKKYTTVLSNLGKVDLPKNYSENIEKFDFILGPAKFNKIDCAVIGFKDSLTLTFSSCLKERGIERDFFRLLAKENINVCVTSNIE